jgi:hypothetical protein
MLFGEGGHPGDGFGGAAMPDEQLGLLRRRQFGIRPQQRAGMDGDTRPARICVLSAIAIRKFTLLRRAVDLLLTAVVLLAPAAAGLAL